MRSSVHTYQPDASIYNSKDGSSRLLRSVPFCLPNNQIKITVLWYVKSCSISANILNLLPASSTLKMEAASITLVQI
jgi:hypothetical protein